MLMKKFSIVIVGLLFLIVGFSTAPPGFEKDNYPSSISLGIDNLQSATSSLPGSDVLLAERGITINYLLSGAALSVLKSPIISTNYQAVYEKTPILYELFSIFADYTNYTQIIATKEANPGLPTKEAMTAQYIEMVEVVSLLRSSPLFTTYDAELQDSQHVSAIEVVSLWPTLVRKNDA